MIGAITAGLFSAGVTPFTNSYESIQTVTVGVGGTSSVAFSSIPSTYKHLQIRTFARSNRATNPEFLKINFNSDTANNYSWHYLQGSAINGTPTAGAGASATYMLSQYYAGAAQNSNNFGAGITDILNYADTNKYKTIRDFAGYDNNGDGGISLQSGSWRNNTSAVSSIQITPGGGALFGQYSSFALYGIKG